MAATTAGIFWGGDPNWGRGAGGCSGGGKAELAQEGRGLFGGVGNVVPGRQRGRVLRTVTEEDAEVVQPCGRIEHVALEGLIFGKLRGQIVEPGLMTEFFRGVALCADVIGDGVSEHARSVAREARWTRIGWGKKSD